MSLKLGCVSFWLRPLFAVSWVMFCPGMIAVLSINPVRPRHHLLSCSSRPEPRSGARPGMLQRTGYGRTQLPGDMRPGNMRPGQHTSSCLLKTEHLFLISTNTQFLKILSEYSTLDVLFKWAVGNNKCFVSILFSELRTCMKMFCFRIIIIIFYVRNCNIYYISNMINIPFTIMNYIDVCLCLPSSVWFLK